MGFFSVNSESQPMETRFLGHQSPIIQPWLKDQGCIHALGKLIHPGSGIRGPYFFIVVDHDAYAFEKLGVLNVGEGVEQQHQPSLHVDNSRTFHHTWFNSEIPEALLLGKYCVRVS